MSPISSNSSTTYCTELLIDCVWMDGEIQCLKQEGFQYKQPVSEIAEISVPTRYKGRSGTYRCIDNGSGPEDVMPCRFYERHKERQREINVPQTTSIILQYNDEEERKLLVEINLLIINF